MGCRGPESGCEAEGNRSGRSADPRLLRGVSQCGFPGDSQSPLLGWRQCLLLSGVCFAAAAISDTPGSASIFSPLPPIPALILFGVSLLLSIVGGCVTKRVEARVQQFLADIADLDIPGEVDDIALEVLSKVSKATLESLNMGFSWVTGTTLHYFFAALWKEYVIGGSGHNAADLERWQKALFAFGYASVITLLVVLSHFLPPCQKPAPPKKEAPALKDEPAGIELLEQS